jgi:hypothetical protein
MIRLNTARFIGRIEQIVKRQPITLQDRPWKIGSVECSVERHRYSGSAYSFSATIVRLKQASSAGTPWMLVLITDRWWMGGEHVIRDMRWIKLVKGRAADVADWLKAQEDRPAL